MVRVDQHPALGVWAVQGVVCVRAPGIVLSSPDGLAADGRLVLAGAQMDHICGTLREGEEQALLIL